MLTLNVETLIDEAMKLPEDSINKKDIIHIMTESIRNNVSENDTYIKIYKELYGNTLIPSLCINLVNSYNNDVKWTVEDTTRVAEKIDIDFSVKPYSKYEFYVSMHKAYHDHAVPLRKSGKAMDSVDWARLADYYLINDSKCKLINYYFWYVTNCA